MAGDGATGFREAKHKKSGAQKLERCGETLMRTTSKQSDLLSRQSRDAAVPARSVIGGAFAGILHFEVFDREGRRDGFAL